MIKLGPVGSSRSKYRPFDEVGCSEIARIFVNHGHGHGHSDSGIYSLQFQYVQGSKLVVSDLYGSPSVRHKFNVVKFNYPSEYITSISGYTNDSRILSLSIGTNLQTYGPYGCSTATLEKDGDHDSVDRQFVFSTEVNDRDDSVREFHFSVGEGGEFGGFFGSSSGNCITSIGVYFKPATTLEELYGNPTTIKQENK